MSVIEGVVVTGAINPQNDMVLTYDDIYLHNPPPGFRAAASDPFNLLSNADCENGTDAWYVEGTGNLQSSPVDPHGGLSSIGIHGRSNVSSAPAQDITAVIKNGATYNLKVWVWPWTSQRFTPQIVINSTGDGLQTFAPSFTVCGGKSWGQATSTITPVWSGTLLSASVRVSSQYNEEFWFDDAELKELGVEVGMQPTMQISPGSWRREASR